MKNYYSPDSNWEMYPIKNKEQYAENLVINGYFHDQIPEDVVAAYKTVEYLMAHAYYYWPMYDEALHKVLLIIEMGIKLKAKQLNIPISIRKKNGKKWDRKLADIIDDVCKKAHLSDLKQKLDRSRRLRNMHVHPKRNSFSGAMGGIPRNIKYCVNVLNRLFRSNEWHMKQQEQLAKTKEMIPNFDNQSLVIESDGKGGLISSILDFETIEDTLFLVCLPVIDVRKLKADESIHPDPVCYTIKDFQISKDQITGKTLEGNKIKISLTDRKVLKEAFRRHQQYIKGLPKEKMRMYSHIIAQEAPWHLSNSEYQYLCENEDYSFT